MCDLKNILSQFADDTSAFLKYEKEMLDNFAEVLQCVETNLGLKVSYEKTTMYRVGSLCNSNARLIAECRKSSSGQMDPLKLWECTFRVICLMLQVLTLTES